MSEPAWIPHGIYGQWKTASSVAFVLRRDGWETRLVEKRDGNTVVYKRRRR